MKHLFVTALTATLSLTAGQALAQTTPTTPPAATDTAATDTAATPAITPPEGYVEGDVVLTSENLEGATVYDANGDDIGEVHGLVFANGTTSLMEGDAAATAPDAMTPDASKATDAADTTATTGADSTAVTTTTDPASNDAASTTVTATDDAATDSAASTTATDDAATDSAASTDTAAAPAPATTAAVSGDTATADAAAISHAIIDVGGFLGMGEHSVAVPIDDLVIYQKDDDIRIYLPWTREQLEALPEFDENDPASVTQ